MDKRYQQDPKTFLTKKKEQVESNLHNSELITETNQAHKKSHIRKH